MPTGRDPFAPEVNRMLLKMEPEFFRLLVQFAQKDRRVPRDQARWMLEQALQQRAWREEDWQAALVAHAAATNGPSSRGTPDEDDDEEEDSFDGVP